MWKFFLVLILTSLTSCTQNKPNCWALSQRKPKSILVVPAINTTTEIGADTKFIATISGVLAERGYYVFPVAVVDAFFKSQGIESGEQAKEVPLQRIRDIFGADAILYTTISDWATKYRIFDTFTSVEASYQLVDVVTGEQLWSHQQKLSEGSNENNRNDNIFATLIVVALDAGLRANSDAEIPVAFRLNSAATSSIYFGPRREILEPADPETGCNF